MFTVLKVREDLPNYEDPGWYKHPPGTVADIASEDDLKRDGIQLPADSQKSAALGSSASGAWCGTPP